MSRLPSLPALSILSILIGAAIIAALWFLGGTLVIFFIALLLAAVIDAAIKGLRSLVPMPRPVAYGLVCITLFGGLAAAFYFGGAQIIAQLSMLYDMLEAQADTLEELFTQVAPVTGTVEDESPIPNWLPNIESLFSHAGTAFGMTLGVLGNVLVVLFLALFLAIDPAEYRNSFVRLFPMSYRPRLIEVTNLAGDKLRIWLVSQMALMVLIGVSVGVMLFALGIENALLLGLVAGGLNFIPYLGPILAGIPVFFAVLGEEPVIFFSAIALYLVIQNVEGYIVAPLVQKRMVKLPPAWSMLTLTIMGTMFGAIGIAIAVPLYAVLQILVEELYIKDVLEKEVASIELPPETPRSLRTRA